MKRFIRFLAEAKADKAAVAATKEHWVKQTREKTNNSGEPYTERPYTERGLSTDDQYFGKVEQGFYAKHEGDHHPNRFDHVGYTHDIIDYIAKNIDPNNKKAFTPWLTQRYHEQDYRLGEDDGEIKNALHFYNNNQAKFPMHISNKDEPQFRDVGHLYHEVEKRRPDKVFTGSMDNHPGIEKVHEAPNLSIYHLKTQEGSMHTRSCFKNEWCTSRRAEDNVGRNYFPDYTEGSHETPDNKLYVIRDNKTGKHFQWHPQSGEFNDAHNQAVTKKDFAKDHPEIKSIPHFQQHHEVTSWKFMEPHEVSKRIVQYRENGTLADKIKTDPEDIIPHMAKLENYSSKDEHEHANNEHWLRTHPDPQVRIHTVHHYPGAAHTWGYKDTNSGVRFHSARASPIAAVHLMDDTDLGVANAAVTHLDKGNGAPIQKGLANAAMRSRHINDPEFRAHVMWGAPKEHFEKLVGENNPNEHIDVQRMMVSRAPGLGQLHIEAVYHHPAIQANDQLREGLSNQSAKQADISFMHNDRHNPIRANVASHSSDKNVLHKLSGDSDNKISAIAKKSLGQINKRERSWRIT